jgi:ubiquinol-cytochrome c reductase cytochrome c subunit
MVMRVFLLCSSLVIASSVLGAQTPPPASAQGAPAGNGENGKKIFTSYGCYQCHGFAAQGGAGARLAPRPIAFAALSRYVRRPTGQMPPYTSKVVSDQELADIYAFLLTIPQPPAANTIPILAR